MFTIAAYGVFRIQPESHLKWFKNGYLPITELFENPELEQSSNR